MIWPGKPVRIQNKRNYLPATVKYVAVIKHLPGLQKLKKRKLTAEVLPAMMIFSLVLQLWDTQKGGGVSYAHLLRKVYQCVYFPPRTAKAR